MLFTSRNNVIKLYDDYSSLVTKARYKVKHGKVSKILTPKRMLQRLPIAGNTSENLLNEIRQIIYSLYQGKEVTKNVYNNIMNSIKL